MTTLTITSRDQVTFTKEVLKHLGLKAGDKIKLELLPHGRAQLMAESKPGSWDDVLGCLKGKTNGAVATIDEINKAIEEAGAEAGTRGL